jgi:hypothetical protein
LFKIIQALFYNFGLVLKVTENICYDIDQKKLKSSSMESKVNQSEPVFKCNLSIIFGTTKAEKNIEDQMFFVILNAFSNGMWHHFIFIKCI